MHAKVEVLEMKIFPAFPSLFILTYLGHSGQLFPGAWDDLGCLGMGMLLGTLGLSRLSRETLTFHVSGLFFETHQKELNMTLNEPLASTN